MMLSVLVVVVVVVVIVVGVGYGGGVAGGDGGGVDGVCVFVLALNHRHNIRTVVVTKQAGRQAPMTLEWKKQKVGGRGGRPSLSDALGTLLNVIGSQALSICPRLVP